MIGYDGIRLKIRDSKMLRSILESPKLEFTREVNSSTGEVITNKQRALYKGMEFELYENVYGPSTLFIYGNLPKYYDGRINITPFMHIECTSAIEKLCKDFDLVADKVGVIKIEIGVNVPTKIAPEIIMDCMITYKGRRKDTDTFLGKGLGFKFPFQHYEIKIYCKSCQLRLREPLLRIELVCESSIYLKKHGISCLSDLMQLENQLQLSRTLIHHIDNFIYYDRELDMNQLSRSEKTVIQEYRDPVCWFMLMKLSPDNYRQKKKRFREIIEKHAQNNWRKWLKEQLIESMQS